GRIFAFGGDGAETLENAAEEETVAGHLSLMASQLEIAERQGAISGGARAEPRDRQLAQSAHLDLDHPPASGSDEGTLRGGFLAGVILQIGVGIRLEHGEAGIAALRGMLPAQLGRSEERRV